MKRAVRIVGWGVLVLVGVSLLAVNFFAGSIITGGVRSVAPQILKVPVELDGASARLLRGKVGIRGLAIGNPQGFKTDFAFKLATFDLAMSVPSVFTDRIRIDEVLIDGPEISYELSLHGSNLGALMKALEPDGAAAGGQPAAGEKPRTQKRVEIGLVRVTNAKIKLSGTALQGNALTLPLPTVELKDIGKDKDGSTVADALSRVLTAVVSSVGTTVAGAAGGLTAGAEAVGSVAVKGVEAVAAGASAAGETVAKEAQAAGAAVAEGARAAGEAVGRTTGKLLDSATSLFRNSEDQAQEETGQAKPTE